MRYRVWRAGAHRQQVPALPYEKYPLGESDKPRKARAIRLIRSKTAPHAAHPVRRSLGSIQGCRRSPTRGQRCPPRHVPPLLPPVRVRKTAGPFQRWCLPLSDGNHTNLNTDSKQTANPGTGGGSWSYVAVICRSACRDWGTPSLRLDRGFRVALSPSGQ